MSLVALTSAVEDMANMLLEVDCGDTFSGMTCAEMETVATVLAVAGRLDAAAHVIMMHGEGDDEHDDAHRDVFRALMRPGAGFSHDEADEPYRLAMAHARELV